MRYKDYSLNNKKEVVIGDVENGIDFDKIRPYYLINTKLQSDEECLNCRIAAFKDPALSVYYQKLRQRGKAHGTAIGAVASV